MSLGGKQPAPRLRRRLCELCFVAKSAWFAFSEQGAVLYLAAIDSPIFWGWALGLVGSPNIVEKRSNSSAPVSPKPK